MNVKKIKKRVFNFKKFFCFLFFLVVFVFSFYSLGKVPISHIKIVGNKFISDLEVIEAAKIENYPSFLYTFSSKIKNNVKKIPFIKDVEVHKLWGFVVSIHVEEYNVLFYIRSSNQYMLNDLTKVDFVQYDGNIPILINYVPDDVLKKLTKKLDIIDYEIVSKISEIEYSPTAYDSERFILYMQDGNQIFITLNKIKEFSNYFKIKEQLGSKKGILYLDSGNYFEIKE